MILVEVYVAAVDESYDFMLDENAEVEQIIEEISEMITKKIESTEKRKDTNFLLCSMERKEILSMESTLYRCKIRDGSRLLLV